MSRSFPPARKRVGQVSFYEHHGGHWVYFREAGKPQRQRVGSGAAEIVRGKAPLKQRVAHLICT